VLGQGPFEVAQLVGEAGELAEGVRGTAGAQLPHGEDLRRSGVAWQELFVDGGDGPVGANAVEFVAELCLVVPVPGLGE
jgi:hypothetical protein